MKLNNCNFNTWSKNHSPEHKDRIFRELYPYRVFEKIDVSEQFLYKEQVIDFNNIKYFIEVLKIELQENNRYKTTISITTNPKSKNQSWKKRSWNEKFQLIYSRNFEFITVFTKNEDSSKDYLKRFFKGNFDKITLNKSIPISNLLFRTFVLNLSEDLFGNGQHYKDFEYLKQGIRYLPEHPQFKNKTRKNYSPLYSKQREIWVLHSFNEEKAHRIGFYNGNQAKELYVVYCNPTYTKHHRCKYENVHIVSIFEFVFRNSKKLYGNYDRQIRFLQNHLNKQDDYSKEKLLHEIQNPKDENYEIYKSELMEALGIMKIIPENDIDLFHYLSAMNLLNAWINRNNKKKDKKDKLFRDMYFFKTYLSDTITGLIKSGIFSSKIYLQKKLITIELYNFQFSFHHIPLNPILERYLESKKNIEIAWSGKRLQPISSLLFRYAKELTKEASA